MPLDVIQEKSLTEVIDYALEYPSMVLAATKSGNILSTALVDFSYGLYIGYISGVFFDKFLSENKRFLNDEEMTDFYAKVASRNPEIMLKIKAHLKVKQ
ncbi:hypothetical protein [Candidatus Nitrosotenuis cloacae]|uniref:hypothetical protein n=1 Tax=Candidatus Nitrosotenuis cloacae TaxID=1603555 RepID=UPI00227E11B7|nr:hypothetical protein [Candidatus Nitrosotenuis cloacae]